VQFTGTGVAVAANDIGIILDPAVATVNVPAGGSTTFPLWVLAGPNLPNSSLTLQCSGGPSGAACSLDHNTDILIGDSFGSTRDKFMVTVSVPAKSGLAFHRNHPLWWIATFVFGILFLGKICRNMSRFAAVAALLIIGAVMISCGGSSSGTGSTPLVITATPSPGTPHSLTVPLVVQ
jgi:hypothetical protein